MYLHRPSWAPVALSGRILTAAGQGIRNCDVTPNDNHGKVVGVVDTIGFGQYAFRGLEPRLTYIVSVNCGRHRSALPTRMITVVDDFYDFDLIADPT